MLKNVSSTKCTLDGYPRLVFLDKDGQVLHFAETDDGPSGSLIYSYVAPSKVTLEPGGYAAFGSAYGDNPFNNAKSCPSPVFRTVTGQGSAQTSARFGRLP